MPDFISAPDGYDQTGQRVTRSHRKVWTRVCPDLPLGRANSDNTEDVCCLGIVMQACKFFTAPILLAAGIIVVIPCSLTTDERNVNHPRTPHQITDVTRPFRDTPCDGTPFRWRRTPRKSSVGGILFPREDFVSEVFIGGHGSDTHDRDAPELSAVCCLGRR